MSFWMDNSPNQFKTTELFVFFTEQQNTKWDFFIENHGKNVCDTRFSQISAMLKSYKADPLNKRLESTKDVIDALRHEQDLRNKLRREKKKPIQKTTQLEGTQLF